MTPPRHIEFTSLVRAILNDRICAFAVINCKRTAYFKTATSPHMKCVAPNQFPEGGQASRLTCASRNLNSPLDPVQQLKKFEKSLMGWHRQPSLLRGEVHVKNANSYPRENNSDLKHDYCRSRIPNQKIRQSEIFALFK